MIALSTLPPGPEESSVKVEISEKNLFRTVWSKSQSISRVFMLVIRLSGCYWIIIGQSSWIKIKHFHFLQKLQIKFPTNWTRPGQSGGPDRKIYIFMLSQTPISYRFHFFWLWFKGEREQCNSAVTGGEIKGAASLPNDPRTASWNDSWVSSLVETQFYAKTMKLGIILKQKYFGFDTYNILVPHNLELKWGIGLAEWERL